MAVNRLNRDDCVQWHHFLQELLTCMDARTRLKSNQLSMSLGLLLRFHFRRRAVKPVTGIVYLKERK